MENFARLKDSEDSYMFEGSDSLKSRDVQFTDCKYKDIAKTVKVAVVNESGNEIELRKGDDLGVLKSLEVVVGDCEKAENEFNLNFAEIYCGEIGVVEIASLSSFMVDCDDFMGNLVDVKASVQSQTYWATVKKKGTVKKLVTRKKERS